MLCYAKSLQSCPTLCDPIDGSPSGSLVPGILQARTLEWVAISFSNAWKWKVNVKSLSCIQLLATPWTAAYQASLSMGFSRQEYWSGVTLPSPWRTLKFQQSLTTIHVYSPYWPWMFLITCLKYFCFFISLNNLFWIQEILLLSFNFLTCFITDLITTNYLYWMFILTSDIFPDF